MNVLTEMREIILDHKSDVLADPFRGEPEKPLNEDRKRWGHWWDERFIGITSKALRENGWLKVLPLRFAAMWSDPDFWQLIRDTPKVEVVADFINQNFFSISSRTLDSCLFNMTSRLFSNEQGEGKRTLEDLPKNFLGLVNNTEARLFFLQSLLRFVDHEDLKQQKALRPQLERFSRAKVDRAFAQYLMYPREADKRELIIRLSLSAEDLKDLKNIAKEFAADCEDVFTRPGVRYFPDKRITKRSGPPIKEVNIIQVEKFVELLLENTALTGYEMAQSEKFTPSNLKLAHRARKLVALRHGIQIREYVELRDGKRVGRKPRRKTEHQKKMET